MVGFIKNLFGLSKSEASSKGDQINLDDFLSELPEKLGYDVTFKRRSGETGGIHVEVEGDEARDLLGDNTEVLDALSHVSMRVLRRAEGLSNSPAAENQETLRVVFDASGFREQKANELRDLAKSQRERVIESGGKPAYIKALSPAERKIIHTTLTELGEVVSESIGKGTFKRIRIKLKDDSQFRRAQPEGGEMANGEGFGNGNGGQRRGGRGGRGGQQRGGQRRGGRGGFGGGGRGPNRPNDQVQADDNYGNRGTFDDFGDSRINDDLIDENLGNRLAPGEKPIFPLTGGSGNSGPNN